MRSLALRPGLTDPPADAGAIVRGTLRGRHDIALPRGLTDPPAEAEVPAGVADAGNMAESRSPLSGGTHGNAMRNAGPHKGTGATNAERK